MNKSLEDSLLQAVISEDCEEVLHLLDQGADPTKNTTNGKTCLGEAANVGNILVLNLLIDTLVSNRNYRKVLSNISSTKQSRLRSHKRKLKHDDKQGDSVVKNSEKNQGYFVFVHSEGSSNNESRVPPTIPVVLTPSPQRDLEWDDELGSFAPTTSEDETWSSLYEWYAAILESTGFALASASKVSSGIDHKDGYHKTALHYASEEGHVTAAKLLLRAGCKVDIASSNGMTPLLLAVIHNRIAVVQALLAAGSNINYRTHDKMTPLHFAAARGFMELVKILVSKDACLEARDSSDRTPLYLAATGGHVNVVLALFVAGAKVNCEDSEGFTPLCEAVGHSHAAVVEALLDADARITHRHKLLHSAIVQRQGDILRMLTSNPGYVGLNLHSDSGDSPLLLAVRTSQTALVRMLLEKGADVNTINTVAGVTALHIAVEHPPEVFEAMLSCLLEYDIDLNATAPTGDTALYRAIVVQKDHAAMLLIKYGADVNVADMEYCGLDNLTIAKQRRTPALVSMLLKAGHVVPVPVPMPVIPRPTTTQNWLYYAIRTPMTLSDLCRIKIRMIFKNKNLYKCVKELPLPASLNGFLMMEDEVLYKDTQGTNF